MTTTTTATPTEIAQQVLGSLEAAWNAGDGDGYAAPYDAQATFVNVNGLVLRGAEQIAGGHAGIFASIYRDSRVHYEVDTAHEWADGVIQVTANATLEVPQGPLAGTREAVGSHLLVRTDGTWKIAATQNVLVVEA
jgi:uncharacterized protein (TIGR02246 family)